MNTAIKQKESTMSAMPAKKLQQRQETIQTERTSVPVADRSWHPEVGIEYAEAERQAPTLRSARRRERELETRHLADAAWHPAVSEERGGLSSADAAWHPAVGARYTDPAARRSVMDRTVEARRREVAKLADSAWHPVVDDVRLPEVRRHEGWRPVAAPTVDGPVSTTAPRTTSEAARTAARANSAWHPGAVIEESNASAVVEEPRGYGENRGGSWRPVAAPTVDGPVSTNAPRTTSEAARTAALANSAWHPQV